MQGIKRARILTAVSVVGILGGCAMWNEAMRGGGGHQVSLSGRNEVPPVSTAATGSGMVMVKPDCSVSARITVSGMTATAAHIHEGAAGVDGPVIVPLKESGSNTFVAAEGAKFTESQCAAHRAGNTYVNVHSAQHKGGEVRAQLK